VVLGGPREHAAAARLRAPKDVSDVSRYYTHAIPDVFPEDGHLNIEHGAPAPASLEGWPCYDDIAHQQATARWLKSAHDRGLNLVVVSAVNFQAACKGMRLLLPEQSTGQECGDMENVKRQLEAAQRMDRRYEWYEIAVHPWHARKIIDEGKLAVVLSLEVSNLFPKAEGDFVAQLEELRAMGLRSMQLAHETNSQFAGAATHRKIFDVFEGIKHPLRGDFGFDDGAFEQGRWRWRRGEDWRRWALSRERAGTPAIANMTAGAGCEP